jgi:hypothetical protein
MEVTMKTSFARWTLVALACLALGACKQQRDPVKPIAGASAVRITG